MGSDAWALCRELRRRKGWSQRQLAAAAGVTAATISRIEKGRMEPTLDLLTKITRRAGFMLAVRIEEPDPDEAKSRAAARSSTVEERLRQNDRLSAIRATRP